MASRCDLHGRPTGTGTPALGEGERVLARLAPARTATVPAAWCAASPGRAAFSASTSRRRRAGACSRPTARQRPTAASISRPQRRRAGRAGARRADARARYGAIAPASRRAHRPYGRSAHGDLHRDPQSTGSSFPGPDRSGRGGAAGAARRATDLRDTPLVTIDGADARDFDDAVCAEPDDPIRNPAAGISVVAIADVAHYVRPGDALDREARRAATRSISPTASCRCCPEELSNDLCSLRPDEDRACMAVHLWIDARRAQAPPPLRPRLDALARAAHLRPGPGGARTATPTRSPRPCSDRSSAALRRLRRPG